MAWIMVNTTGGVEDACIAAGNGRSETGEPHRGGISRLVLTRLTGILDPLP